MRTGYNINGEGFGFGKIIRVAAALVAIWFSISFGYNWYLNVTDSERICAIQAVYLLNEQVFGLVDEEDIDRVDANLQKGIFTLGQIGSSPEEYTALRKKYFTRRANIAMANIRRSAKTGGIWFYSPKTLTATFERLAKKAGMDYDPQELQRLQKEIYLAREKAKKETKASIKAVPYRHPYWPGR